MPTILPINLDVLTRNTNRTIEDLPDTIRLNTVNYKLFAVTMGNSGHFISALSLEKQLCSNPGWYIYDGLSEYRRKGQRSAFACFNWDFNYQWAVNFHMLFRFASYEILTQVIGMQLHKYLVLAARFAV